MLKDLSLYKDAKRNEPCPCGSTLTFKKCCMKPYRAAKEARKNAKVSPFTPLPPLSEDDKEKFTSLYEKMLFFSNQYKNDSDIIFVENPEETTLSFLNNERDYFYKNSHAIVEKYSHRHKLDEEELLILEALKEARYETFFLLSCSPESAVIADVKLNLYNIRALHSPFTELFKSDSKYLGIKTALLSYKGGYIVDGLFSAFSTNKEIDRVLDEMPFSNPEINYMKDGRLTSIPLLLTFSLFCDVEHFEKMEEIVLKRLPDSFTKELLSLFDNEHVYKQQFVSSFLRSTDLAAELNSEEGDQTFSYIMGGLPVLNFEFGNKENVIAYEQLEKYYKQKPLSQSASKMVYENVKNAKSSLFGATTSLSSFYTMLGITHMNEEHIDDFQSFLYSYNTNKEQRRKLAEKVEDLFKQLSHAAGFTISPVFLGLGTYLDDIYVEIEAYREAVNADGLVLMEDIQAYSIDKGGLN